MPQSSHDTLLRSVYLDENKLCVMRDISTYSRLHDHEFLELAYVLHGSAEHQMGTQTSTIREGDFLMVDLGSLHGYRGGQELEIINCLFAPEYVDRALVNCPSLQAVLSTSLRQFGGDTLGDGPADCIMHDTDGTIRPLMEAMLREYEQKQPGYLEIVRCHLIEILVHAVRMHPTGTTAHCHPVVAAIADELQAACEQPFSLDALGRRYGYTPQYISSLFHQETGVSLTSYLQRLRVEKACQLLVHTSDTIAAVARLVGYDDAKHFTELFRRYMGMSPRELRKTYHQST
jgi:AraC-like DNA-binding protein